MSLYIIKKIGILFFPILLLFVASSCNTTKYLQEGEKLVEKNTVKIESSEKIEDKADLLYDLSKYYKQKPNSKFLGLFRTRLWFYFKNQSEADTSKWSNWVNRVLAEAPVIQEESLVKSTAKAMKSYMQHKGYFNAQVEYNVDTTKHFTFNTYTVYPYRRYYFDTIQHQSKDRYIQRILNDTKEESYLKSGLPVDVDLYNKEVTRLIRQMRTLGYLDFTKNYIAPLAVDTSDYKVNATLNILSPLDTIEHQIYTIGNVYVYPNYIPNKRSEYQEDIIKGGVTFMSRGNPDIKYPTLKRNIHLKSGDRYDLEQEELTKVRLASLDLYKFISIKAVKSDSVPGLVDFYIYLPSKDKQALGGDIELNTANNSSFDQVSIGTSMSINYSNRNLLKGAEKFSVDVEGGLEFALKNNDELFNSIDVNANAELSFPKFVDYMGVFTILKSMKILPKKTLKKLKATATTKLQLGYDYLRLINFYDYNSLNGNFGFNIIPSERWRVKLTQTGLTYFNPVAKPAFDTILTGNPFLQRSFDKQLFTGIFFNSIDLSYIEAAKKEDVTASLRLFGEVSGIEQLILNKSFSPTKEWLLFDSVQYAHYLKFEAEQKYAKIFTPRTSFAFRAGVGIAAPYGSFSDAVPYVKQFHIGGPNSLRAWSIREVGPGGYRELLTAGENNTLPFYQTGDLKMEMNMEYRFDMFWYLEGAIFLDVGNIWTLKDDGRENAQLSKDFWKQFAIGTGFGFRLDFSYFIMRFDLGYPIRNNYLQEYYDANGVQKLTYWPIRKLSHLTTRDINFNLAIGYPF